LSKIILKKQNEAEIEKEINREETLKIIQELSMKFDVNLMNIIRKVALNKFDGFSINKNHPYTHLHIGNGLEVVYFELMGLDKEMKIKITKEMIT